MTRLRRGTSAASTLLTVMAAPTLLGYGCDGAELPGSEPALGGTASSAGAEGRSEISGQPTASGAAAQAAVVVETALATGAEGGAESADDEDQDVDWSADNIYVPLKVVNYMSIGSYDRMWPTRHAESSGKVSKKQARAAPMVCHRS